MTAVVKINVLTVAVVVVVVVVVVIIIFEHFLYNTCIYSFLPHLLLLFCFVETSTTLCRKIFFKRFGRGGVGELLLRVKRSKKGEGPGGKECKALLGKKGRIMFCL